MIISIYLRVLGPEHHLIVLPLLTGAAAAAATTFSELTGCLFSISTVEHTSRPEAVRSVSAEINQATPAGKAVSVVVVVVALSFMVVTIRNF